MVQIHLKSDFIHTANQCNDSHFLLYFEKNVHRKNKFTQKAHAQWQITKFKRTIMKCIWIANIEKAM